MYAECKKSRRIFFPWTRRLVWTFCATLHVQCSAWARLPIQMYVIAGQSWRRNLPEVTEHVWQKLMNHDSPIFLLGIQQRPGSVRNHNSHSAKAGISLIFALPMWKSPWWSKAIRRPPWQEWKDTKEGAFPTWYGESKASDCKRVFPSQITQR